MFAEGKLTAETLKCRERLGRRYRRCTQMNKAGGHGPADPMSSPIRLSPFSDSLSASLCLCGLLFIASWTGALK